MAWAFDALLRKIDNLILICSTLLHAEPGTAATQTISLDHSSANVLKILAGLSKLRWSVNGVPALRAHASTLTAPPPSPKQSQEAADLTQRWQYLSGFQQSVAHHVRRYLMHLMASFRQIPLYWGQGE